MCAKGRRTRAVAPRRVLRFIALVLVVAAVFSGLSALGLVSSASAAERSILIVAPHPDDDILYGAGLAASGVARGASVKVLFTTNGDKYDGPPGGLERQNDAAWAQVTYIGTTENDLVFLGYPDGALQSLLTTNFSPGSMYVTSFGQSTTYGARGLGRSDYHYYRFGSHALYNGTNVLQDLEAFLAAYRPDDIYTPGPFDEHGDHSATYQFVRAAVANRAAADGSFSPAIHTTIVHWNGHSDWPTPLDPQAYMTEPPGLSQTGLSWSARESYVVPPAMQSTNLAANPKYRALEVHVGSSGATGWLGGFIKRDEVFWTESVIPGVNRAPTAVAGANQNVVEQTLVQLDGSGSSDPDGDALTYAWTQTAGPTVTLSSATRRGPPSRPRPRRPRLTFQLVVNDGQAASSPSSVTVTVAPAQTNVANIASLATVTASTQNTSTGQLAVKAVDGSAAGYPGDYTREWATTGQGAGAWLKLTWPTAYSVSRIVFYDRPNSERPDHGRHAALQRRQHADHRRAAQRRLGADARTSPRARSPACGSPSTRSARRPATSGSSEIEVYGQAPGSVNRAPTAVAGASQNVVEQTLVQLDGSGSSDPDGDALTYAWTQTAGPTVTLSSATAARPTFTAPAAPATLTFQLVVNDGQAASSPSSVTVTVAPAAAAQLSIDDVSVTEGNSGTVNAVFTVRLSTASGLPVSVAYATADETAIAGADYTSTSGTLQFAAGTTAKTVTVAVLGDQIDEADETFVVNLSGAQNATIADGRGVGTIVDDDARPSLSIDDVSVTEGNSGTVNAVFTVRLSTASGLPVSVAYATADETAIAGADYTSTSGTLQFAAGTTAKTVTVAVLGDQIDEADETFVVNLSGAQNATIADGRGVGTIVDDDTSAVANIASLATVTASTQNTSTGQLAVKAVDGSAAGYPGDYTREWATTGQGAGAWLNLTWPTAYSVSRIVLHDRPNTNDQITGATLRFSDGGTLTTGALPNDGSALTLNFTARAITSLRLTVDAVSASTGNVGLSEIEVYGQAPGSVNRAPTAVAGANQNVVEQTLVQLDGSGSSDPDGDALTYAWTQTAGPTVTLSSATAARPTFTAPAAPATLTFQLVVNDGQAASSPSSVTVTVAPAAAAQLSIDDVSVTEGNSGTVNAVFTVRLSTASGLPVSVAYATADETAIAGADYTSTSGTLQFAAGTTAKTVTVAVLGDQIDEADETFVVNLSGAQNATIADGRGVGTIVDDDTSAGRSPGVFGLRGANTLEFSVYRTSTSTWEGKAQPTNGIEKGGALTTDGTGTIYASEGNSTWFYKYDIAANVWTRLADPANGFNEGGGVQYLEVGGVKYVYAALGNSTLFRRYTIATNSWTSLAGTPATVRRGGAITTDGTYLYVLQGDLKRGFWRYDVGANSWTALASTPASVGWGGALTRVGGYFYAFRGGGQRLFWRYDVAANSWTAMAPAPGNVYGGGALTSDGTAIYAFQGGTRAFWRYDVAGNTWSTSALVNFSGNVGQGGALVYDAGWTPGG